MARTRYRWDEAAQKLVEVGADWSPTARLEINVDRNYENLDLQDGTVVNSRRQHREYMKARGVTLADDFKGVWAKAQKEREAIRTGTHDSKARREAVGRAVYELEKRRR
jgi:hypothetical protein